MIESVLQVGDFARNKIHGYVTFLYFKLDDIPFNDPSAHLFLGVCVEIINGKDSFMNLNQEGIVRSEVPSELEKFPSTFPRIFKAKEYLEHFNAAEQMDNLSYVELLYNLNEKEKELKNEN